jgi:hypothetical protein
MVYFAIAMMEVKEENFFLPEDIARLITRVEIVDGRVKLKQVLAVLDSE